MLRIAHIGCFAAATILTAGCVSGPTDYFDVYGVDGSGQPAAAPPVSPSATGDTRWQYRRDQGTTIAGHITDVSRMSPQAPPYDHLLVTVRDMHGRTIIADLGPAAALKDFPLKSGQQIILTGRMAEAHGQWMLIARHIMTEKAERTLPDLRTR